MGLFDRAGAALNEFDRKASLKPERLAREERIAKLEHDVPYGSPFCPQCSTKDAEILGLLKQINSLEDKLAKTEAELSHMRWDKYPDTMGQ